MAKNTRPSVLFCTLRVGCGANVMFIWGKGTQGRPPRQSGRSLILAAEHLLKGRS